MPQTIASETAQNSIPNSISAVSVPPTGTPAITWLSWKKKPSVPKILLPVSEEIPKPTAHQASVTTARLTSTLATPAPTFFCLEKPISKSRKPACISRTSTQATITQVMSSSPLTVSTPMPAPP